MTHVFGIRFFGNRRCPPLSDAQPTDTRTARRCAQYGINALDVEVNSQGQSGTLASQYVQDRAEETQTISRLCKI